VNKETPDSEENVAQVVQSSPSTANHFSSKGVKSDYNFNFRL